MFKQHTSPQPHIQKSIHTLALDPSGQLRYAKSSYTVVVSKGELLGELAFLGKPYRQLSAVAKLDSLVIVLNLSAFNLVVKDRILRE